jgi:hypothetical protein
MEGGGKGDGGGMVSREEKLRRGQRFSGRLNYPFETLIILLKLKKMINVWSWTE